MNRKNRTVIKAMITTKGEKLATKDESDIKEEYYQI